MPKLPLVCTWSLEDSMDLVEIIFAWFRQGLMRGKVGKSQFGVSQFPSWWE